MRIKTDDPQNSMMEVVVTGKVEKFAEIRPAPIVLRGKEGEPIIKEMEIIPRKEYPFSIKSVKAFNPSGIKCKLIQTDASDGGNLYRIEIINMEGKKGRYRNEVLIQTTSELRPVIRIRVITIIQ